MSSLISALTKYFGHDCSERNPDLAKTLLSPGFEANPQEARAVTSSQLGAHSHSDRFRSFAPVNGLNLQQFRMVCADFDGLQADTERLRQICWKLVARSEKWGRFFGSREAIGVLTEVDLGANLKPSPKRSIFEDTIGAAEKEFPKIIAKIASLCCKKEEELQKQRAIAEGKDPSRIKVRFDSKGFNFKEFKKDRDALVDRAIDSGLLRPNKGLLGLYNYVRWAELPFVIVTQSRKAFVEKVLKKIFGKDFEMPLIVSKEDLEKYGITPKPSPQPYRFAVILVTLNLLEKELDRPIFGDDRSKRTIAASLCRFKLDSRRFLKKIDESLGEQAAAFKRLLPPYDRILALEDSYLGAKAGREMQLVLVSNSVDRLSHQLSEEPDKMSQQQLNELDSMIAALHKEGFNIAHAGKNLRAVTDILRLTNPLSGEQVRRIAHEERLDHIDLNNSYQALTRRLAERMGIRNQAKMLMLGSERSVDRLLLSEAKTLPPDARVLDAGAGTTIPFYTAFDGSPKPNPNFSSPTLARVLALNGFDVVTIDGQPHNFVQDGKIKAGTLIGNGGKPIVFSGQFEALGLEIRDISGLDFFAAKRNGLKIPKGSALFKQIESLDPSREGRESYTIFPLVAAKLERSLFGVKAFGNVDLLDLDGHIRGNPKLSKNMDGGFDLIFSRNMPPLENLEGTFIKNLLPHLREGGKLFFEVSKTSFARDGNSYLTPVLNQALLNEFGGNLPSGFKLRVHDLNDAEVVIIERLQS